MDVAAAAFPELVAAASAKAMAEWDRPATHITHLIVSTNCGGHAAPGVPLSSLLGGPAVLPGYDLRLPSLLGVHPSVRRTMLYHSGCAGGSTVLRLAKDIAESNRGARVLVVCADLTLAHFHAPDEARMDATVMQALFGDGAAAVVVGADPHDDERPLFEMVAASQSVIPECDNGLLPCATLTALIRDNVEQSLG